MTSRTRVAAGWCGRPANPGEPDLDRVADLRHAQLRTLMPMKTNRLELRLTDEERDLDASAAAVVGETLSEFFRQAARERALQIADEQRVISLSEAEARRFLEALDNPDPDTVNRLRELWDRPSR